MVLPQLPQQARTTMMMTTMMTTATMMTLPAHHHLQLRGASGAALVEAAAEAGMQPADPLAARGVGVGGEHGVTVGCSAVGTLRLRRAIVATLVSAHGCDRSMPRWL